MFYYSTDPAYAGKIVSDLAGFHLDIFGTVAPLVAQYFVAHVLVVLAIVVFVVARGVIGNVGG